MQGSRRRKGVRGRVGRLGSIEERWSEAEKGGRESEGGGGTCECGQRGTQQHRAVGSQQAPEGPHSWRQTVQERQVHKILSATKPRTQESGIRASERVTTKHCQRMSSERVRLRHYFKTATRVETSERLCVFIPESKMEHLSKLPKLPKSDHFVFWMRPLLLDTKSLNPVGTQL